MNTLTSLPMVLAMVCAAWCSLIGQCRNFAHISCAAVMVACMVDATYLHAIPPLLAVALVAGTGLWVGLAGLSHPNAFRQDWPLRLFRIVSSLVMAASIQQHGLAMEYGDICQGMADGPPVFSVLSGLLLLGGLVLTTALMRGVKRAAPARRLAALEPALMGLSLVLMVL